MTIPNTNPPKWYWTVSGVALIWMLFGVFAWVADLMMDEAALAGVRGAAEQIRAVGADKCIIATDFGVYTLPPPVEGMRAFIACMLDLGITADEIRMLTAENPARLLGLD